MTVLAATKWPSNAHMIESMAELGYLKKDMLVLDPTYGMGKWWTRWRPDGDGLVAADLADVDDAVRDDFTDMRWPNDWFDAVAFDPPYVAQGGKTKMVDYHARYGRRQATTPEELQADIDAGLAECHRVLKPKARKYPGGVLLVKVQDYVWSGKFWEGTYYTRKTLEALGFEVIDRFEHIGNPRPQPQRTRKCPRCKGEGMVCPPPLRGWVQCGECDEGRVPSPQVHGRRNLSTLFVARKV